MEKQASIPELSVQSITAEMLLKSLDNDPYDEDQVQHIYSASIFTICEKLLLEYIYKEVHR